jgi:hypothetical protein
MRVEPSQQCGRTSQTSRRQNTHSTSFSIIGQQKMQSDDRGSVLAGINPICSPGSVYIRFYQAASTHYQHYKGIGPHICSIPEKIQECPRTRLYLISVPHLLNIPSLYPHNIVDTTQFSLLSNASCPAPVAHI